MGRSLCSAVGGAWWLISGGRSQSLMSFQGPMATLCPEMQPLLPGDRCHIPGAWGGSPVGERVVVLP